MLEEINIFFLFLSWSTIPFGFKVSVVWFFKLLENKDVQQNATEHNSYHSISGEGFPTPSQQNVKASPSNRILLCGWTVTVGGTVMKQRCEWGLNATLWLGLFITYVSRKNKMRCCGMLLSYLYCCEYFCISLHKNGGRAGNLEKVV